MSTEQKKSTRKPSRKKRPCNPVVMLIWDGFGLRKCKQGNATVLAKMPTWHRLMKSCPSAKLTANGKAVGLPNGQVGNSEAGHMTMGAGRPVETDLVRINKEIKKNAFHDNPGPSRT
jgi:2,3-bisphosphoglycerate-independent phosphoglycerate mutase